MVLKQFSLHGGKELKQMQNWLLEYLLLHGFKVLKVELLLVDYQILLSSKQIEVSKFSMMRFLQPGLSSTMVFFPMMVVVRTCGYPID